ncbi:MAG TPA: hypothetical protein VGR22_02425 [Thermomicrobiales bacterium]|nr:hypothetical protein [Thermomicrobiales bacterium]
MEYLQNRFELLGRSLAILAAYAVIAGAASVAVNLGDVAEGEVVAIVRSALGLVGIAAGLLVWTLRSSLGWQALAAWTLVQVPFIAWSAEGNVTRQMWDILLGFSSSTTVNGVVTSSEQYGLNGVGIILTIWAFRTRERWDQRIAPMLAGQPGMA